MEHILLCHHPWEIRQISLHAVQAAHNPPPMRKTFSIVDYTLFGRVKSSLFPVCDHILSIAIIEKIGKAKVRKNFMEGNHDAQGRLL